MPLSITIDSSKQKSCVRLCPVAMLHCLHSHTNTFSPFRHFSHHGRCLASSSKALLLPPIPSAVRVPKLRSSHGGRSPRVAFSLLEAPVIWVGRLCIFYALLKAGLAGSQSNPFVPSGIWNSCLDD